MRTVKTEFPEHFLWGGAIAANQADGGFGLLGKGLSISDFHAYQRKLSRDDRKEDAAVRNDESSLVINPDLYYPKQHGIDFFHTYKDDLRLMQEMGLKCFRTSFDWSRIYPDGDDEQPNEEGLLYYDDLLKTIRSFGMEPVMTLSHHEMPIHLVKKYGGWQNRKLVTFFSRYCETLLERYHSQVKYWITFNQINLLTFNSLGILGNKTENILESTYQGVHHQFVASAMVKRLAAKYQPDGILIGTMISDKIAHPATCKPEDVLFNLRKNQMQFLLPECYVSCFLMYVMRLP